MDVALNAKVASVTVSEDRAHVVRRGELEVGAGVTQLTIPGVAPVLVDKTLKVTVDAGVVVGEVRVERRRLHLDAERPVDVAALDAEIDEKTHAEKDLGRKRKRLEVELAGLDAIIAQMVTDLATDTAWGKLDVARARAQLRELEQDEKTKRAAFLLVAEEQRRLGEVLARLRARRNAHSEPATKASASVVITLSAAAPVKTRVQLDYIVPGACWRPHHTAHLRKGHLSFATDACVWQNTGEAWEDCDVAFSTERPSLGREPPLLADDLLLTQRKQEQLVVETREQEVHTAGLGGAARMTAAHVVPGIDDGGQARVMRGLARSTIASDGRPHRVPLASFEADAASELVMMPALAPLAIRKTTQENAGRVPILAGPVDLIEESGLVGRTQVLFVAPKERFELGWGPDPGVRGRRTVEETHEEPGALSSWLARTLRVNIHLSNLDGAPRTIAVTEAVPVSEIEKVQIALDAKETTDGARPDEDGFVRWTVKVPPHGRASVKLRYVLKHHKDVTGL